jgi:alpha-beta hydrolase superfamily lysophospholipase
VRIPHAPAPLAGTLHAPAPLPRGTPTAVLVHGLAADRDGAFLPALARCLWEDAGIASLRFDVGGNGESAAVRPFCLSGLRAEAGDLQAACAYVQSLEGRLAMTVGHSKGGSVVLAHAGGWGREEGGGAPPAVVAVAARFDHGQGIEERFGDDIDARIEAAGGAGVEFSWRLGSGRAPTQWRLTAADLADRRATDMGALVAAIPASTRVLLAHGDADATVPPAAAASFAAAAAHCASSRLALLPGADHNFTGYEDCAALIREVVAFVAGGG